MNNGIEQIETTLWRCLAIKKSIKISWQVERVWGNVGNFSDRGY